MPLRNHFKILAQAVAVWGGFWIAGLPRYYQQYSPAALGIGCTVLSALIALAALVLLARARPDRRASRALWLSVYYTVPFAVLDTLYCGLYLQHGWAYLHRFWYLTVFYFTPWLTFLPTAWVLARLELKRSRPDATLLRRFEQPDESRTFDKGRFDIVRIAGQVIGKAQYEPGWRWSVHVAPHAGTPLCAVEHLGLVVSGRAAVSYLDGSVHELSPGTLFYIPPLPHDSWVIGDEPYVSLHFMGADHYAR